jgi:bifunctional DNase/RNase
VQIAVTELRENTFYATLTLRRGGKTTEVDSRPSDAIALAVRLDTPIYASDDVIASSSIEMDDEPADAEDQIAAFKQFLDEVRPEDFGST